MEKSRFLKKTRRFLKKLKIELPYDPAIPLLGTYPDKNIIQKYTCTTALFTIAKTGNNLISINRCMDKKKKNAVLYIYQGGGGREMEWEFGLEHINRTGKQQSFTV